MRLAIAASLAAVLAVAGVCGWPRPEAIQRAQATPQAVLALLGPELARDVTAEAVGGEVRLRHAALGGCDVRVGPITAAHSDRSSTLNYMIWRASLGADATSCARFHAQVASAVQRNDRDIESIRPGGELPPRQSFATVLLALAAALVGALAVLAAALVRRMSAEERRLALAVLALALVARALAPHRPVMVYFGYELFAQAHFLDSLPRYGPGSTALWALVLGPLAVDHAAILWLHAGLGSATAALWAVWLARALLLGPQVRGQVCRRTRPPTSCPMPAGSRSLRAGWLAGLALALTPLFVRDHVSESLHVPAMAALSLAALAALEAARTRGGTAWAAAWTGAAAVGFAGLCRADVALLALPTVWLITAAATGSAGLPLVPQPSGSTAESRLWRRLVRWTPLGAAAALAGLALLYARDRALADLAQGNLPQVQHFWSNLPARLLHDDVLLRPEWLPVALWLPAIAWLALGRAKPGASGAAPTTARWWALLGAALVWLVPYYADFNETSLPRLQVPAATLFVLCAAGLADAVAAAVTRPRAWLAALGVAFAGSVAATWPASFAKTNPHLEDELLHEARALLPTDRPYLLVTRTFAERPATELHLHFPTYLFQPPGGLGRVIPASRYLELRAAGRLPPIDAWFLRSVRCYAAPVRQAAVTHEHPACTAMAELPGTVPVLERDVQNLGDSPTFAYYGRAPRLRVGLYRLAEAPGLDTHSK